MADIFHRLLIDDKVYFAVIAPLVLFHTTKTPYLGQHFTRTNIQGLRVCDYARTYDIREQKKGSEGEIQLASTKGHENRVHPTSH